MKILADAKMLLLQQLPGDSFGRQVAVVGAGTAFVQVLGMLAAPVLTRLYDPAEFGVMAAFGAVAGIVVLGATLKFDLAIPVANSDEDGAGLLGLSLASGAVFSLLVLAVIALLPQSVFAILSADERLYRYRWYLALAIFAGAMYASFLGWATRRQRFGAISTSRATQSLASVTVQIAGGLAGLGVLGLILGAVSNMASGLSVLWRCTREELKNQYLTILPARTGDLLRKYWKFPVFSMQMAFLGQLGRSAPILVMSGLFGAVATGQYSIGVRVVGLPAAMISTAVSGVFLSRAAVSAASNQLSELVVDTTRRLSGSAACLFGSLIAYGPLLFSTVFGAPWTEAGHFLRILSPWLFLMFVFSPQTTVAQVMSRQGTDAVWQGILLAVRVLSLVIPAQLGFGPRVAVGSFAAANIAFGGAYYLWILSLAKVPFPAIGRRLFSDIIPVAIIFSAAKIAERMGCPPVVGLSVSLVCILAVMHRRILDAWRSSEDGTQTREKSLGSDE